MKVRLDGEEAEQREVVEGVKTFGKVSNHQYTNQSEDVISEERGHQEYIQLTIFL
jgi:hypothetical protein